MGDSKMCFTVYPRSINREWACFHETLTDSTALSMSSGKLTSGSICFLTQSKACKAEETNLHFHQIFQQANVFQWGETFLKHVIRRRL